MRWRTEMKFFLLIVLCLTLACSDSDPDTRETPDPEPTPQWSLPVCDLVSGTPAVTFTSDEGETLAEVEERVGLNYTRGLVTLGTVDNLLVTHNTTLYHSTDSGCTWDAIGQMPTFDMQMVAGHDGVAYAWSNDVVARISIDNASTFTLQSAGENGMNIRGMAADPNVADHLRYGNHRGALFDSTDGGLTWTSIGKGAPESTNSSIGYVVSIDPNDLDHAVYGTSRTGAWVTMDGGQTWSQSLGLTNAGNNVNVFNIVTSPSNGNVVWAMGLESLDNFNSVRRIYRSTDGGFNFTPMVEQEGVVVLINGPTMAVHPVDPNVIYFTYGICVSVSDDNGTYIYRYDAMDDQLTWTHNLYNEVTAITFNPQDPSLMYLGLSEGYCAP